MGDGRTQPGKARRRARCDRRAGRHGVDRGRCQRSRVAQSHDGPDRVGTVYGWTLSALWLRAGRGLCCVGYRLSRSVRRTGLDASDDRRPRGDRKIDRRQNRVFLRLRFAPLRTRRVLLSGDGEEDIRRAGQPRQRPRPRHDGNGFGRHGGQHEGELLGRGARSQPGCAAEESVRLDAGLRGSKAAPGQQAGVRSGPECMDRAVRDVDHQHPQRPPLQSPDGLSLRQRLYLRRDGADRSGREG